MRRPKASDIDDVEALRAVEASCIERGMWTNTDEVAARFPHMPLKVVAAKLARLEGRCLISGCPCGCRGDWELTSAGRAAAGIERAWRPNPAEDHYARRAQARAAQRD